MSFRVTIRQAPEPIVVETGDTILASALAQGVAYPNGCRSGNCGACKSRLISGDVEMSPYSEYALTGEERASGLILACRSVPWDDCEVAWLDEDDIVAHPQRRMSGTVVGLDPLTHDIVRLRLRVESGGPFSFSAGQYASLVFSGQPPRDYSMANRPDEPILEFHIRNLGRGASAFAVTRLKTGDSVRIEGPFGTSHLREAHRGPILAVAGGSGLAPVKSIVETALRRGAAQPIHVYFGARAERDLYLIDHFEGLAARHPNLRFVPVLSEPSGPTARRTGHVGDAAADDLSDLDGFKAYLAGPPVMVEAATRRLAGQGLRRSDIHADAFYTEAERRVLEAAR